MLSNHRKFQYYLISGAFLVLLALIGSYYWFWLLGPLRQLCVNLYSKEAAPHIEMGCNPEAFFKKWL